MTSLRSRTRVCRHTVVCGRLAGGMGPGAIPGASPFLLGAFFGEGCGVLLRSAARRACVLLSCRVGCVFPGWRAWWVGWRFGRLLRIFVLLWCCLVAADGGRCVSPAASWCGGLVVRELVVVCVSMLTIKGACCRVGRSARAGLECRSRTGGEAEAVLDRYHEAVGVEPRITGDLQALGLNLWNLQFRVKSVSGTVDKVLNRGKRFDALYDVIRYTSVSDVGDYYGDFNRTISTLTAKGYQVVEVTDFWKLTEESRAKGGYKGINVKMDSPDGAHFELQFHTPESLQAKESVHVLYERLRRPDVTAAEREEVCRAMDATFSSLEMPVDVLTARR